MADISILSRLVNGFQRNVDVSQNSLIVGSIKIGSTTPVEITKAIATKLLAIQAAADADGTFDSRYTKILDLASRTAGKGASLVALQDTGAYFTTKTVEAALAQLGAAVGTGSAAGISYTPNTGLSGTNVQTALDGVGTRLTATETVANAAIPLTQKGANSGVATLDSGGKVPVSQLPNSVMEYQGVYNASTNTPTLVNGTGNIGDVYRVSVAGAGVNALNFVVGDYAIYNGTTWEKAHSGADNVTSVNGFAGAVVLTTDNVNEGTVNLYYTDNRAKDAAGAALGNTATINLSYNGGTRTITGLVNNNSIDQNKLTTTATDQDTIIGGNGTALSVTSAPKLKSNEIAGEALAATTIYAMRYGRAADSGFVAGRMYKADSDATTVDNFDVQGLVKTSGAVSTGGALTLIQAGELIATAHGFTVGEPLWLSAAGLLTQTTPTGTVGQAVVKVGTVKDANTIRVRIQIISGG
jgi:hypothetical protein